MAMVGVCDTIGTYLRRVSIVHSESRLETWAHHKRTDVAYPRKRCLPGGDMGGDDA